MSLPTIRYDDADNGFQPVHSRKKLRTRRGIPRVQSQAVSFAAQVEKMEQEICDTEWMKVCQKQVEASFATLRWLTGEVLALCLGLGSPTESKSAMAQLVFITSICQTLNITPERMEFYDPHFRQDDIQGLLAMGFNVLTENKHGKYTVKSNTLLFMPHCGVELYENILRQNWATDGLQRLLLLGNALREYEIVTPKRKFEQQMPCLSRICKHLICDLIHPLEVFPLAFNNLALQYMNPNSVPSLADGLWDLPTTAAEHFLSAEIT